VSPFLEAIWRLSRIDEELRGIALARKERERSVEAASALLEETRARRAAHKEDIARLQREADALNLDARSAEELVGKYDVQLRAAKSNKEYQVLRHELDAAKKKQSDIETAVLERLERIDAMVAAQKALDDAVRDAERALAEAQAASREAERSVADEEARLLDRRKAETAQLEPEDLRLYEGLLKRRGDSAVATVGDDGSCSACSCGISRQMENLIMLGQQIVKCEGCGRILFLAGNTSRP
jgi:predicted  nucleic acid-binding Zn-ribbon protein